MKLSNFVACGIAIFFNKYVLYTSQHDVDKWNFRRLLGQACYLTQGYFKKIGKDYDLFLLDSLHIVK